MTQDFQPAERQQPNADEQDSSAVLQDLDLPTPIPVDRDSPGRILAKHREALHTSLESLPDAELLAGQALDPRVSELQQNAIAGYYIDAQLELLLAVADRQTEDQLKVLFGPTSRVVDHIVKGPGVITLIERICAAGNREALLEAIANGPINGELTFEPPASPIELVADLIRWAAVRGSDKKRFRAADSVRRWMATALEEAGFDTEPRLGGVSAVGAALADVLGRRPTMISLGELPAELSKLLDPSMRVIGSNATAQVVSDLSTDESQVGNFCISGRNESLVMPEGFERIMIDGKEYAGHDLNCIDAIVSGAKSVPGFKDLAQDRLENAGREHALLVLTGTKDLIDSERIRAYFDAVQTMHAEGMNVGLLYAETKQTDMEPRIWREMRSRRCVEYFSMNTSEAFDVLTRVLEDARKENLLELDTSTINRIESALTLGAADTGPWESGRENPAWIFESAALLQNILEVPIVRVRGKWSDVSIVTAGVRAVDIAHVRNSLVASRHNGTLKVANRTGLIDQDGELGLLRNVPSGKVLAALHALSDRIKAHNSPHVESRRSPISSGPLADISLTCYAALADGRHCFAVPPVDFYDKSGGTQSAGDTIDVTFLTEEADGVIRQFRDRD